MRRKRLNENKVLNEREENKMSIEQRVISVLDEHHYLEKIREYTYIYYYNKVDYRDKLDLEIIDNLITAAQSGDLTEAWYDLTSSFDDVIYIHEYISNEVVEALEKVAPLTDEELDEVNELLWGFIKIDIDYSTYLDDEVPVYIMVDTGDGNYDFTLNPNYSFNWGGETAEDEPLELASLTWLARTQGYTLDQVLEAFREGGSNNKFLNSIVREGLNNSTSMSAVTFLGTMRILDLLNAASGNGDVTINADTYVGLFDTWSGSGSLFDIELEQGLVIPGNIINRIGTAKGKGDNGYTPDQVYGFSSSVYDSKINLSEDLDTSVLEENTKTLNKNKALTEATANYAMSSKGFKTYVYKEDPSGYHIPHEVKGKLYDEAYKIALQLVDEGDEDFNTYLFDALRELEQEYLSEEEYINFKEYYNNIKRVLDDFLYFYIGNVMDKLESSEHFDKILKERDISVYEVGNFIKEEYDIEIKGGYYSGFSVVIKKHDYMGPEYMGEDLVDEINRLVKEEIETNLYPELEAEGLVPIKVRARFSTGETTYELDESLKSARYTKKLTEAKERVKRYSYYEIDEEVHDVDMWEIWYRDRKTQHIRITNRAGDVYKDKTTYYNRTWERFEYQTVLLKLLNKIYKDEKLVDRIAKQVETNMRHEENNKKELDWLLSLPEGFLVAISACRGKDCSRTNELEKRLRRKNYIRVVGKWDGIEETSFLVFTESKSIARALIETGVYEFNQEDVYVWKTPMTMADITEGTDEGTKLDGKYYYFDPNKIIMNRDSVKEK